MLLSFHANPSIYLSSRPLYVHGNMSQLSVWYLKVPETVRLTCPDHMDIPVPEIQRKKAFKVMGQRETLLKSTESRPALTLHIVPHQMGKLHVKLIFDTLMFFSYESPFISIKGPEITTLSGLSALKIPTVFLGIRIKRHHLACNPCIIQANPSTWQHKWKWNPTVLSIADDFSRIYYSVLFFFPVKLGRNTKSKSTFWNFLL